MTARFASSDLERHRQALDAAAQDVRRATTQIGALQLFGAREQTLARARDDRDQAEDVLTVAVYRYLRALAVT